MRTHHVLFFFLTSCWNALSLIPQTERCTELRSLPHHSLDWLGSLAVFKASLSIVPIPNGFTSFSLRPELSPLLLFSMFNCPFPISTIDSPHHLFSSWRVLDWIPSLRLFSPGTKAPNPQVFLSLPSSHFRLLPSLQNLHSTPNVVHCICPISFMAMPIAYCLVSQLVQQYDYWSAWLYFFLSYFILCITPSE